MGTSNFDPEAFMNSAETTAAFDTVLTTIPESDEYIGSIKTLKLRTAKDSVIMDVTWSILNLADNLKQELNLAEPTVRQSIFLDFDGNGRLASGPNVNVQLGQLREACGQNVAGTPWRPLMLQGAGPCKLKVTKRVDPKNAARVFNDVAAVTRMVG